MEVLKIFELLKSIIRLFSVEKKTTEGGIMVTYAPNTVREDSFLAAEYIPN